MEVAKIYLDPNNVLDFQEEDVHSHFGRKCLDLHMELNAALEEATRRGIDGGGTYASWLNDIGISHQTDQGWWNQTAVDPENMQAFADYWNCEDDESDLCKRYLKVVNILKGLPKKLKPQMTDDHVNVEDYLKECEEGVC